MLDPNAVTPAREFINLFTLYSTLGVVIFALSALGLGTLERMFGLKFCDDCQKNLEDIEERQKDHDRRREVNRTKRKSRGTKNESKQS